MLSENCPVATSTTEDSGMSLNAQSDTPGENLAPVQPEPLKAESQQTSPSRGEVREGDSSLTEESGSDSDSSSNSVGLNLNLKLGQKFRRRAPLTCLLRGICLLFRGLRLIGSKIL